MDQTVLDHAPDFLYRFRSVRNLLDRNELENQEIYFAHPETLNDPIEGYLDIFWQGDSIVWTNLFKHYLLCLQRGHLISQLGGPATPLKDEDIHVLLTELTLPTDEARKLFKSISVEFFKNQNIQKLIEVLGEGDREIRRDELFHYLQAIHPFALAIIRANENPARNEKDEKFLHQASEVLRKMIGDLVLEIISAKKADSKTPDTLFGSARYISEQQRLLALHKGPSFLTEPGKRFVVIEFPERYIEQIERLLYPEWYTACFLSEVNNAAMWGHYGDSHKGVCLKFKAKRADPAIGIDLNCITSYSATKNTTRKNRGDRFFNFEKVVYDSKYPKIDFFRSIGRLPFPQLLAGWYTDEAGNKSKCIEEVLGKEIQWRKQLWANLTKSSTVKLEEWKHEKEYRILLMSMLGDLSEKEDRLLKFRFSDLEGIVFGMKTSIEDKERILDIVEKKCVQNKRDNFKFFQAIYSQQTGRIEIVELSALIAPLSTAGATPNAPVEVKK